MPPRYPRLPVVLGSTHPELRAQVRAWLDTHLPSGVDTSVFDPYDYHREGYDRREWERALARQGWTAPTWPRELGGGGYTRSEALAIGEELAAAGAPPPLDAIGLTIVGPALLEVAGEEQQRRWIPPITRGDAVWCQLFSEPDSGSDLASMRTTATADPGLGGYVVYGQKIWTSNADFADHGLLVTRVEGETDGSGRPAYVALAVDMHRPEVTVRPVAQPHGRSTFSEVFLDGVPVGSDDRIGSPGDGWRVAIATLLYERGALGGFGFGLTAPLLAAAATLPGAREAGRERHLRAFCDAVVHQLWVRRASLAGGGDGPPGGTDWFPLKVAFARHNQRLADVIWRSHGVASGGSLRDPAVSAMVRSRANTIEGGTTEVLLNNIGERILGLPR
ncbi:MAG: acyl-CoA dehydrogenase family protein [Acidimicrobiia bacterium]